MSYYSEHKELIQKQQKAYEDSEKGKDTRRKYRIKYRKELSILNLGYTKKYRRTIEGKKRWLIGSVKARAKRENILFNLTIDSVDWPEFCPVLGIKLDYSATMKTRQYSPSIDRIKPELGYVINNVKVISYRANMLKSSASLEEVEKILKYVRENSL